MERRFYSVSDCFLDGGFKAMLESFEMGLDIVNSIGGRSSGCGQSVGSVFYTSNTRVHLLHVLKMFLLEQCDLLLEVHGGLDKTLIDFFEEVDIRFSLHGILSFFGTVDCEGVSHFLVLNFGGLKFRKHLL